jgi:hypothetical protein
MTSRRLASNPMLGAVPTSLEESIGAMSNEMAGVQADTASRARLHSYECEASSHAAVGRAAGSAQS